MLSKGLVSESLHICYGHAELHELPLDTASRIDDLWQQAAGHAVLQIRVDATRFSQLAPCSVRRRSAQISPVLAPEVEIPFQNPSHPAVVSRQRVHLPTIAAWTHPGLGI